MTTLSILLFHWGQHWGGKWGFIADGPVDYLIIFGIFGLLVLIMYALKRYKK